MKPAILVALLFRTTDVFVYLSLIFVLTSGGPGGATETLSVYAYNKTHVRTNQLRLWFGCCDVDVRLCSYYCHHLCKNSLQTVMDKNKYLLEKVVTNNVERKSEFENI